MILSQAVHPYRVRGDLSISSHTKFIFASLYLITIRNESLVYKDQR